MRAILERDYLAEARKPRAFAARTAPGLFGALVIVFGTLAGGTLAGRDYDRIGSEAFEALSVALFVFLLLTTPFLLVGSLLPERQGNTLEILLATPEGARGIAGGKFLSRLGTALAWTAAALPPLTVAVLFGGTSWRSLFNVGASLLGTAVELAAWGLLVSASSRKLATAAVIVYLFPAAHWAAAGYVAAAGGPGLFAAATSPLPSFDLGAWDSSVSATGAGAAGPWLRHPGLWHLLFAAALAAFAVPVAARMLAREESPGGAGNFRIPRLKGEGRLRALLTRGNPVAWKESLLLNTAWSRLLYYVVLLLLVAGEAVFLVMDGVMAWEPQTDLAYLIGVFTILMAMASVQGAASMAFEKSQGTFDLLRASPLTPAEIARGKFLGTVLGMAFLLLIPFGHLAITVIRGNHHPITGLVAGGMVLLMSANCAVHGLTWGTIARTPATALIGAASMTVFALGSCWTLCLLPFVLAGLRMAKRDDTGEFFEVIVVPGVLCGSPVLFLFSVLPALDAYLLEEGTGRGPAMGAGVLIGTLSLAVSGLYFAYWWHRLPEVLRREMAKLGEGGGVLWAPGRLAHRPTGDRLAEFVRRQREGRERRKG